MINSFILSIYFNFPFFDSSALSSINRYIYRTRNIFVLFDFPSLNFLNSLFINLFINLSINPFINSSADLIFNVFVYPFLVSSAATVFINFKKFSSRFFSSRFSSVFPKRENSPLTSI